MVRATLLQPTGRLSFHSDGQPALLSNWPNELSKSANLTWHYAGSPSQIIRNTRQQTPAMPLSPPSRFWGWGGLGAITPWLSHNTGRDNLTSAQSGVLSLTAAVGWNTGLGFKHMSVIYRSVFHRRAVQGLRNACLVLPGLSACRFCLFLTSLGPTQACTLMHMQKHTCMSRMHVQTHMKTSLFQLQLIKAPLHPTATTRWLPCKAHHHPRQHQPLENFHSSTVKSKNAANCTAAVMMMTTPLVSRSSSEASSWLPANVTCAVT